MDGTQFALILTALALALCIWQLVSLTEKVHALEQKAWNSSSSVVNAAIEDLRTALAQVNATNRREFGSIWKRLGLSRRVADAEEDLPAARPAANDDSFQSMVDLQSTPPVKQ